MRTLLDWARAVTPRPIKKLAREAHRDLVLGRLMRAAARDPDTLRTGGDFDFDGLVYGWGNEGWSALGEYLQAAIDATAAGTGPILECGSGLSTLIVAAVAQHAGRAMWSLEHHPEWASRVGLRLRRYGFSATRLVHCPIVAYDADYDWYAPPLDEMPRDFSLVLCDGPPGSTRGGRYGLLPVMRSHLRPDCTILLDDGDRADERAIAERWAGELGTSATLQGSEKPYFVIGQRA